jgi:hypothetical protein
MKKAGATLVLFMLVSSAAFAKPPTASFNPGYQRALEQSRKYRQGPVMRPPMPMSEGTRDGSDYYGSQEARYNY